MSGEDKEERGAEGGGGVTWREECEMGDSKVTVWERDGEAGAGCGWRGRW